MDYVKFCLLRSYWLAGNDLLCQPIEVVFSLLDCLGDGAGSDGSWIEGAKVFGYPLTIKYGTGRSNFFVG